MRHAFPLALCTFLTLVFSATAEAQIFADKSIFYWNEASPPVQNVALRNSADHALMVEVKIIEVKQPGTPEEKLEPSEDILVSPKRFSVPPRGERTVRLLRRGEHGKAERVFRVSFVPQARDDEDLGAGKNISITGTSGVLTVLTGVGILIFTQPSVEDVRLSIERKEDTVVLKNEGNVNIAILKIRVCDAPEQGCTDVVPKRLYPGNTFQIPKTSGKLVFLRKRVGDKITEETAP